MTKARRILIAGCGYVGTELGLELTARGDVVFGLRRDGSALPAEISPVVADLCDPDTLRDLPRDLDACVYTAAANGPEEDAYRAAYVEGPGNVLAAVDARHVVFTSSTGVYGQDDGSWIDEDSPTVPTRATGELLLEGERLCVEASARSTIVRLGGIYGPGRDRLVRGVRDRALLRPRAPVYTNRIHRDDAAGFLAHVLRLDEPEPLYLGVDDDPADRSEVITWIARELGLPDPPLESEPSSHQGKRCSNGRLRATGYELRFPTFREGYAGALR